jgi:hypothetical protein
MAWKRNIEATNIHNPAFAQKEILREWAFFLKQVIMCIKKICSTIFLILAALMINFGLCVIDAQSYIDSVEIIPENPTEIDDITLKVYGYFPNGCWGYNSGTHSININQIAIDLYAYDVWVPGLYCSDVIIPYSDEFNIGQLVSGEYSINVTEYRDSLRDPFPDYYFSDFFVVAFVDADSDGIPDSEDNCPDTINPNQLDTYPPQGNNIGDACDCECDFTCDGDVDGGDVGDFLDHFGRSTFFKPCTNEVPCRGDVDCNSAVDGFDVGMFLEDFGRSQYFNPCPACVVGDWCEYP